MSRTAPTCTSEAWVSRPPLVQSQHGLCYRSKLSLLANQMHHYPDSFQMLMSLFSYVPQWKGPEQACLLRSSVILGCCRSATLSCRGRAFSAFTQGLLSSKEPPWPSNKYTADIREPTVSCMSRPQRPLATNSSERIVLFTLCRLWSAMS